MNYETQRIDHLGIETGINREIELAPGYFGKEVKSEYGGVAQRWLVVLSQTACERELKTLEKAKTREQEAAEKQWRKVCQLVFNCQEDAKAACKQFNQHWKFIEQPSRLRQSPSTPIRAAPLREPSRMWSDIR